MSDERLPVVIVTGLSGAGKVSILRALEDLGFDAIDNPPLDLLESLVLRGEGGRGVAVGIDARSRGFDADAVLATLARLRLNPTLHPDLVFAWADEQALLRRYTETRRRHPLAPQGRVADGIALEQQVVAPLHATADLVIDTSDLPLPDLRALIDSRYGAAGERRQGMSVTLMSFAFPAGLPREADMVLDARFLRNPHYDPQLRPLTGTDPAVVAHIEADPDYAGFVERASGLIDLVLPRFVQEGKKYATIAIGCTGGRHRSVAIVERLRRHLSDAGWRVSATHRELARGQDGRAGARREATSDGPAQEPPVPGTPVPDPRITR